MRTYIMYLFAYEWLMYALTYVYLTIDMHNYTCTQHVAIFTIYTDMHMYVSECRHDMRIHIYIYICMYIYIYVFVIHIR